MGLYIKYLKPPESCDVCPVRLVFTTCGCDLDHCMFLEAPEPHGRLIDADAMFKDICDSINEMTAIGVAVDGQWLWDKLNDALENAPTIIPASKEGDA